MLDKFPIYACNRYFHSVKNPALFDGLLILSLYSVNMLLSPCRLESQFDHLFDRLFV